jgi:predicted metal-dependent phosphoesterase TrpH
MRRVRFDPHVHTAASYDSSAPVGTVLAAAREAGLDAVAVTDHDTVAGNRAARDRRAGADPLVVPGVEVSTADGHLLALGVDAALAPDRPLATTVAAVHERGGVAVVPHPFQRLRHGVRPGTLADCPVDALETYNACSLSNLRNRQADRYARREGLPRVGGSDAHRPGTVGRAYTAVDVDGSLSVETLLDGLRAGRTHVHGRLLSLPRYVRKYATNACLATGALRD